MSNTSVKINIVAQSASLAVSGLAKDAKNASKNFFTLNTAIKDGNQFLSRFGANLAANLTTKLVSSVAQGFRSMTSGIFESTKALEVAATKFEVLTGSAGKANEIIRDLQDFTARTPFQFEAVSSAAQKLLSFGFSTEAVKSNLQDLGDVAAASGADLGELSLIYGQVAAAGKLTGERLLQLQERAIPIGPALAKSLGVAESSVRDMVSKGKVSLAVFEDAFKSLNEEGQFAFNGIEKASKTLQGRLSTLSDNVDLLFAGVGQRLAPALKAGTTALTEFVQQLSKDQGFNNFIDSMANQIPNAVRLASSSLITAIELFTAFRVVANLLVGTLFAFAGSTLSAAESVLELASAVGRFTGLDTTGIDSARDSIKSLKDAANETADDIAVSTGDINLSTKQLTKTIEDGATTLITAYNREKQAAEESANAVVDANLKKVDAVRTALTLTQLINQEFDAAEAERKANLDILNTESGNQKVEMLKIQLGEEEAARVLAQAAQLENEGKTNEALKILGDARIKAYQNEVNQKKKLDEQREADQKSTLSTISTLQGSSNKTLAAIGKAAALTQIAIDGPAAVTKALAAFPPPFNFAAATAVGAAVAAQAAKVAGLSFERGGIVPGTSFTGDKVSANVNSGEMILNRQQQTNLFKQIGSGSSQSQVKEIVVNTTVNLDGEVVARSVSRQVADGFRLGENI